MGKLENKIAIITGGTSGIGLAAARLFAAEGASVTVTSASAGSVAAAKAALAGVAEVVLSDAGATADIEKLAAAFAAKGSGVDIVFINAGIAKLGPIAELDEATFDATFRLNVRGPWLMLKHFAPLVRRGGSFVFNTSINNQLGMPGTSVYGASKAALRSLVRVAASELAPSGVRVNAVSPGPTDTALYGKLGFTPDVVKGFAETLIAQVPLKRFGRPEEIAKAALFLASDDSSFMTGEEIVVDGGMTRV